MKYKIIVLVSLFMFLSVETHAQIADESTQKPKRSSGYFSIGTLNRGSYSTTVDGIPFRLYYPDKAEILVLGFTGPVTASGWLHGFFNLGAPLRDIRADVIFDSRTITEQLNVATMYMDFGLAIYPMSWMRQDSRFQPFFSGSIGTNVIADNWGVILLLGLSGDTTTSTSDNSLADRIDFDWMFSYGGGIDYYFSSSTGVRLSFRKLRLNLPGGDSFFNPMEFNLGVIGRF